jgi:hypothetical protein
LATPLWPSRLTSAQVEAGFFSAEVQREHTVITALASGRGRTAMAENGSGEPVMAVMIRLTVTSCRSCE